jgi:HAD superfamily hydrolase (TIGR01509 family)
MKKISAVIFDCDGVMFDSRQANVNYYNHILKQFDLPPMTESQVDFVHMNTAEESVRHIFRGTPHEEQAQAFRIQMDYTPFIKDMIIEPGLKQLLQDLKPRLSLAVATNRSNDIGMVLESNGLDPYFDIVVSSLDVENPKPHPESIIKILDFFGIEPEACIYVGDSEVDLETCQAGGIPLIAYKNMDLKAQFHIQRLMEIKEILEPE